MIYWYTYIHSFIHSFIHTYIWCCGTLWFWDVRTIQLCLNTPGGEASSLAFHPRIRCGFRCSAATDIAPTEEHKSCAEKPWKNPIEGRCLHWCLRAMLHFSYHSNYSYLLSVRLFICYALTTCLYNNSLNSCFVLVLLPESGKYLQHCCWRTLWPAPAYALLAESTYTWQAKHLKRESTTAPRWTKSWPFFRFQLQLLSEDGVCLCWCCPPCFCCSASICLLICEACEEDLNPIPFA